MPAVMQVGSDPQSAQPALSNSCTTGNSCCSALKSPAMWQEPLPKARSSSKVARNAWLSFSFWPAVPLEMP